MNSDDLETISWKPRIEAVQQRCGMLLRAACCALLIMSSLCEFALAAPETASTTPGISLKRCSTPQKHPPAKVAFSISSQHTPHL